ncbi:MAG: hypothetical protein GC171_09755 [Terrimonas sp.]|nr:hypothetical protein [Terrimonas sp.]
MHLPFPQAWSQAEVKDIHFNFYGESIDLQTDNSFLVDYQGPLSEASILSFYQEINTSRYEPVTRALSRYKELYKLDDWLFYQLIRQTAQRFSPKMDNYIRYTLYKWFLLSKTGYNAMLTIAGDQILFYVQSDENVYNIPYRVQDGKQFVCLNYHDYGSINFDKVKFSPVRIPVPGAERGFTYKITQLPDFDLADYTEKDIQFDYYQEHYDFKVKLNPDIQKIFANYPVVDYSYYFNIPLSKGTYESLIPELKKVVKGMRTKNGVDYLMHFTRYAFLFKPDTEVFGAEKRLSPEETLLYKESDCDDRAALFFFLIKEIYDLPMIVLSYPKHVTIAVNFDKPIGNTIVYNGKKYSVCEPTPQRMDLPIGKMLPQLRKSTYEVAYEYRPGNK